MNERPKAVRFNTPFARVRGGFSGPVGRSADPVFTNFGLSFCLFFNFRRVLGVWMLISNRPIRRCGHFDRTILSGDEILGHFGRFFVLCKNLKNQNHEKVIFLDD